MLANVENAVLLVAKPLGGILFAELLYYGDGRLKHRKGRIYIFLTKKHFFTDMNKQEQEKNSMTITTERKK